MPFNSEALPQKAQLFANPLQTEGLGPICSLAATPFSLHASERQHVHHLVKVLNVLSQLKHDESSELSLKISIWEEISLNRNLSLNYKSETTRHIHRES